MKLKYKGNMVQITGRLWSIITLIVLTLFLALCLFLSSGCATFSSNTKSEVVYSKQEWSTEYEDIFWFCIKEMGVDQSDILFERIGSERPPIYITSFKGIHKEYAKRMKEPFEKFYKMLREDQGKTHEEATQEIKNLTESVGAFFDPPTNDIYIGIDDSISGCRLRARTAHEISHYIQVVVYGRLPKKFSMAAYDAKLRREYASMSIERTFGLKNCPEEVKDWKFYMP